MSPSGSDSGAELVGAKCISIDSPVKGLGGTISLTVYWDSHNSADSTISAKILSRLSRPKAGLDLEVEPAIVIRSHWVGIQILEGDLGLHGRYPALSRPVGGLYLRR